MLPFEQQFCPSTVSAHCPGHLDPFRLGKREARGPAPVVLLSRPHAPPGPPTPSLARHAHRAGRSVPPPKNRREARAALFTHQLGWEVRLLVGSQLEVVQTQVCRDQEEVLTTGERWKAALAERVAVMSASDRDDCPRRSQLVVDRGLAVPRYPRAGIGQPPNVGG